MKWVSVTKLGWDDELWNLVMSFSHTVNHCEECVQLVLRWIEIAPKQVNKNTSCTVMTCFCLGLDVFDKNDVM